MDADTLSDADVAYVRANYRSLADVCREHGNHLEDVQALVRELRLPAPSYVLPDGTEMVPADYFALVDEAGGPRRLRAEFERRHEAARRFGRPPTRDALITGARSRYPEVFAAEVGSRGR